MLALAAVLAMVVGGLVGRSIVPSPEPQPPPQTVRHDDTLWGLSISYPATWTRLETEDRAVRLIAAAPDRSASLRVSVRRSGLEPVTADSLPVVRPLTDQLLSSDDRIVRIEQPSPVELGGLPGYRYEYAYRSERGGTGAHIHFFLFRDDGRLIQLVLQAGVAAELERMRSTFDRIAASFEG